LGSYSCLRWNDELERVKTLPGIDSEILDQARDQDDKKGQRCPRKNVVPGSDTR